MQKSYNKLYYRITNNLSISENRLHIFFNYYQPINRKLVSADMQNKKSSGDEIANVLVNDDIAHT